MSRSVQAVRVKSSAAHARDSVKCSNGFQYAEGGINGVPLERRRIYWRRWVPAQHNGKTVLIVPGYAQRSRELESITRALSARWSIVPGPSRAVSHWPCWRRTCGATQAPHDQLSVSWVRP
jgi:hypothetical protein